MGTTNRGPVLGNVDVEGEIYLIATLGADGYEAIRAADSQQVGTLAGESGWVWRLRSERPELMHAIFEAAMLAGLFESPPSE